MLTTFNGVPYVEEQLVDILDQSREINEIVVRDDASSDDTFDIVHRVASQFPPHVTINIRRNPARLGVIKNVESALRDVSNDIVILCDQDDRWDPDRVQNQVETLRLTDSLLTFSDGTIVDQHGRDLGYTLWRELSLPKLEALTTSELLHLLLTRSAVTGAATALRRELLDLALPLPPSVPHDMWLALCAASQGRIVPDGRELISYRVHHRNAQGVRRRRWNLRLDPGPASLQWRAHLLADLLNRASTVMPESIRTQVEQHHRFLEERLSLPRSRLTRILPVARRLLAGDYTNFASGRRSAVVDILRPAGQSPQGSPVDGWGP